MKIKQFIQSNKTILWLALLPTSIFVYRSGDHIEAVVIFLLFISLYVYKTGFKKRKP